MIIKNENRTENNVSKAFVFLTILTINSEGFQISLSDFPISL